MAGRRPRLVHEGSSILDESDNYHHHHANDFASSSSRMIINDRDHNNSREHQQHHGTDVGGSSLHRAVGGSKTTTSHNKPKLQTKFIVGQGTSSLQLLEFDDSMMSMPGDDEIDPPPDDRKSLLPMTADESSFFPTRTNNYKLRTRHVVGMNQCDNDFDDNMIMDDEDGAGEHEQLRTQYNEEVRCNSNNNPIYNDSMSSIIPIIPIYNQPSPSTSPLVILDGANIAYNYYDCVNPSLHSHSSKRRQPDSRGIRIAIDYFVYHHCRVQAVVPVSWYQLKPRPADQYHLHNRSRGDSDARMVTEEVEELRLLRQRGLLVAIPPGDDDDAYALALARREDERLLTAAAGQEDEGMMMLEDKTVQHFLLPLGGYIVSNDMFHDAIRRDEKKLCHHELSLNMRSSISLKGWLMKRRISYSFANVGTTTTTTTTQIDTSSDIQLDFVPNPRSDLIEAIDEYSRLKSGLR